MFGKKKEERRRPHPQRASLAQLGLLDVPTDLGDMDSLGQDDDDDDEDLEAELLALTAGAKPTKPKRAPKAQVNLDAMIAASMKDIPSDEEVSEDDSDPELLAELNDLVPEEGMEAEEEEPPLPPPAAAAQTPPQHPSAVRPHLGTSLVTLLEDRLAMYREAEKSAQDAGETSRARRFNRGVKTLGDQLKQARAGRVVSEEDIPPPVATGKKLINSEEPRDEPPQVFQPEAPSPQAPPRPVRVAPPPPPEPAVDPTLVELQARQLQFKKGALAAKKAGDSETALKYMRIAKQFDSVMAAVKSGNPVDLSEMPSPPVLESDPSPPTPVPQESQFQGSVEPQIGEMGDQCSPAEPVPKPPSLPPELLAPPPPTSVLEALTQRLARYQAEEKLAKDAGNTSKARRMGRITKQYQDALKQHKAGRPFAVDELPTPPGYAPIPVPGAKPPAPPPEEDEGEVGEEVAPAPVVAPEPTPPPRPARTAPPPLVRQPSEVRNHPQSRQEKQTALLLARQREFKEAALAAKKRGELEQARELLRQSKGFDALLQASASGLPVDLTTLPVPPNAVSALESDFELVSPDECEPGETGEIYEKLLEDFGKQIKLCLATRDHFRATGDVAGANRFEHLAVASRRDLDMVRMCRHRGEPVPRFKYETRSFSVLQCCTDLGDNDIEIGILQGISYNVPNPKEVDTYVKFEFPFPAETPPKDKTALVRDTNNPQYNHNFVLPIARTSRACLRVFKRQGVKLEVWSKGGFLRSDTLIGSVTVKLQPLETKCILHESFPLMDGRKAVGGQLEVRLRVRHPLVTRQVEQRQERWVLLVEGPPAPL